MLFLKLEADENKVVTSERDPDEAWGHESTHTSWYPLKITVSDKDSWKALSADFDVNPGDVVHCVYVVYSNGNSFSHNEGAELEVVSFHKSTETAIRNRDTIATRKRRPDADLIIEFDSGATVERHWPWDGYFESFDYVDIFTAIVQQG